MYNILRIRGILISSEKQIGDCLAVLADMIEESRHECSSKSRKAQFWQDLIYARKKNGDIYA